MANLALIQKTIDLPEPVISSRQLHGTEINRISSKEANEAIAGDGLITNISGLSLMIKHADCQAALFYDPIKKAIANVHSGWRGSVQNIYQKTVEKMKQEYGSKPEDILVGISPSLGPEAAQFINYKTEIPKSLWKFQIKPLYFDFWAISEMQLTSAGILPDHIEIARQCTFSNEQDFFSHRRNPATGRHGCFIALKRHYE
jgi:YfiH family protein